MTSTILAYSFGLCASDHLWVLLVHSAETIFSESLVQDTLWEPLNILSVSLLCSGIVVQLGFFVDELLEFSNLQTEKFEIKVKVTNRLPQWFIVLLMEFSHVRMFESLLDRNPRFWIKFKHSFAKIDSLWILTHAKKIFEVFSGLCWKLFHKGFIVSVLNFVNQWCIWTSCQVDNHFHLLCTILCWHERLPSNHFSEDTTYGPYINRCCILLPWEYNFRGSVPSCCDVVSKLSIWRH